MAPRPRVAHVAHALTASLAGVAIVALAAFPAAADPGHGKGSDPAKAAAKAAMHAQKDARKAAEKAQKEAEKHARKQAELAAKAARAAAKASPVIVLRPPVQVSVAPITVPPVTADVARARHCSTEQAKLLLRRSQLDAQVNALNAAEAAARGAGRLYEADYLRVEIARVQKDIAQVAYELQKKQAECVGVPLPSVPSATVPPISVPPVTVPVTAPVPTTVAAPACAGARGQLTALLRQIRNASRHAAHAQAQSFRARSRGESAKADAKLAEATRLQQRVSLLTTRRAALAAACPAAA